MNYKKCALCRVSYDMMHRNWYGSDNTESLCRFCGEEKASELRNNRWKKVKVLCGDDFGKMAAKRVVKDNPNFIHKTAQIARIDSLPFFLCKAQQ